MKVRRRLRKIRAAPFNPDKYPRSQFIELHAPAVLTWTKHSPWATPATKQGIASELGLPLGMERTVPTSCIGLCGKRFCRHFTTASTAIPGEAPRSGACGGIQLLGLEDRQIRQKWRSSSGVWSNRVGKGCRIFASHAAPNAFFKHFGAYIERNVAAGHEKTARCCAENGLKELSPDGVMRRRELASPWPSRRVTLPRF